MQDGVHHSVRGSKRRQFALEQMVCVTSSCWVVSSMSSVRGKAGLPWPVNGTYVCGKCHHGQVAEAGTIAERCTATLGPQLRLCNCAYFTFAEPADPLKKVGGAQ